MSNAHRLKNDQSVLSEPSLKRRYNRALFAIVAPRYFIATRLLSFFRDRSWKRFLLSKVTAPSPKLVLDLATGSGDLAALAVAKWPAALVVGADISLAMMAAARNQPDTGTIRMSCMDMSILGLRSGSVDVVTAGYALRNAPDLSATLIEIRRVLKSGGMVAFLDFSRSPIRSLFIFQYWVLRLWGALWGIVLHGNPAVYAYIAESLLLYPNRNELGRNMVKAGFKNVLFYRRMMGLIDVIVAIGG